MRIRSIKPEFWRSADITSLPLEDRLLFIGLWSYVDDNGVGRDELPAICADLFADDMFSDSRETVARVHRGLERFAERGLIVRYIVADRSYHYISAWEKHQKIDRPSKPRYPGPDQGEHASSRNPREDASRPRETLAAGTGEQGNRGTGEQGAEEQGGVGGERVLEPTTPTPATAPRKRGARLPEPFIVSKQMRQWAAQEVPGLDVDAATRTFVDYWRSASGRTATKLDWVAAWRNWLRRDHASRPAGRNGTGRESSLDRRDRQREQMFADLDHAPVIPIGAIGA